METRASSSKKSAFVRVKEGKKSITNRRKVVTKKKGDKKGNEAFNIFEPCMSYIPTEEDLDSYGTIGELIRAKYPWSDTSKILEGGPIDGINKKTVRQIRDAIVKEQGSDKGATIMVVQDTEKGRESFTIPIDVVPEILLDTDAVGLVEDLEDYMIFVNSSLQQTDKDKRQKMCAMIRLAAALIEQRINRSE